VLNRFACRGVGRIARRGKILAGPAEIFRGGAGGDGIRGGLDAVADEPHDEAGAGERFVQGAGRVQRFAGGFGERAIGFGVGEIKTVLFLRAFVAQVVQPFVLDGEGK
jgi:hypothetical protein